MSSNLFHGLDDDQWFQTVAKSIDQPVQGLPAFPSSNFQEGFVGKSGLRSMEEAFLIYKLLKTRAALTRETKVLDFGVGYGRILRLFVKDVDPANLYGVDVDRSILDDATRLGVEGTLLQIEPIDTLPFPNAFFDIAYAFSVFSHLPPDYAHHWLNELMRSIRPGGLLLITTMTDHFLEHCLTCKREDEQNLDYHQKIFAKLFDDPSAAIDSYRAGKHMYSGTGGAADILTPNNYGWAAMPRKFIEDALGAHASYIEFIDGWSVCNQGIFLIRKI
jgi:SAM-dependent methyltransferase